MNKSNPCRAQHGFSLIELIVVIAIIAIIAGFAVPQAGQILKGSTLTQGSTILVDQIRLAREYAVTRNSKVEVRFYQYGDPETPGETVANPSSGNYRAIQIFQIINVNQGANEGTIAGETAMPIDKVQMLPQGVIMDPGASYSTLLNNQNSTPIAGSQEPSKLQLPRGIGSNYNYVTFRFLQDGSTNLPQTGTAPWFITLHNLNDRGSLQGGAPYNFFCLQIDPVSGSARQYRPQAG